MLDALNGTGAAAATEPTAKEAVAASATAKGAASEPASGRSVSDASVADARAADQVVIRAGSPLPVFREMATNGLRQLGALLPVVERQLVTSVVALTPALLGHLARAMGDAALQVGAGVMTQGGRAAAPSRLIVTAYEDGSKIPTLPFMTKATGSAPEAVLAAPLTDDWAGLGKSPATVSKPATSAAGASASKSDSSIDRASVRPGAAEADFPGAVTRPSVTRLAAPRQAGGQRPTTRLPTSRTRRLQADQGTIETSVDLVSVRWGPPTDRVPRMGHCLCWCEI